MFKNLSEHVQIEKTKKIILNEEELNKIETELIFNDLLEDLIYEGDEILDRYGVDGYNKPIRTPDHATKSHLVVAKEGNIVKVIRFGAQDIFGAGDHPKTLKEQKRRSAFKKTQAENIAKGKLYPAYWADKVKW